MRGLACRVHYKQIRAAPDFDPDSERAKRVGSSERPAAEWGVMIAEGQLYLGIAWWISVFPGLAIALLALGFSLVADGLAKLLHTSQ